MREVPWSSNSLLMQDNKERQVILDKDPLTKAVTVCVCNKQTGKIRVYRDKKKILGLLEQCI